MKRIEKIEEIGKEIKRVRKNQKINQENLSFSSNVSPRLIGEIERGKETVRLEKVFSLIENLGGEIYIKWRYEKDE